MIDEGARFPRVGLVAATCAVPSPSPGCRLSWCPMERRDRWRVEERLRGTSLDAWLQGYTSSGTVASRPGEAAPTDRMGRTWRRCARGGRITYRGLSSRPRARI